MEEEWKVFPGLDGHYMVSNLGNVLSNLRGSWRALKGWTHSTQGYTLVNVRDDSRFRRTMKVSRMVALAFIPNPLSKPEVNHKNGVKTDNRVENLEWVTGEENNAHALATGLVDNRGERNGASKLNEREVSAIRYLALQTCASNGEIARAFRISPSTVSFIATGKRWAHSKPRPRVDDCDHRHTDGATGTCYRCGEIVK